MSTANERRALRWLERTTAQYDSDLNRAILRALKTIAERADLDKVGALLAENDVRGAARAFLDAGTPAAQIILRGELAKLVMTTAGQTMRGDAAVLTGRAVVQTSVGSEALAQAVERLTTDYFPAIFEQTQAVLERAMADGLRSGMNPRSVAREVRQFVGMTEHDYNIVSSYELALRSGDYTNALGRELRDARFDGTLRTAREAGTTLTDEQIAQMTGRYGERLVSWRAETWSRTLTLNAAREGNLVGWRDAAAIAGVDEGQLVKTWVTTLDGRERPEHHDADGITVPVDQPFPVDGGVMVPGQGVYNCRCTFTVAILPEGKLAAKKFLQSPERNARGAREDYTYRTTRPTRRD
jgi:hypothetical protein